MLTVFKAMPCIYCNCTQTHPVGRESIHLEALRIETYISKDFFATKFFSLVKARETFSVSVFIVFPRWGKSLFLISYIYLDDCTFRMVLCLL